jgi:hypothetical protein
MTYPDGIDALINVNAGDTLAAGGHAARHNSTNTALAEVRNFLASGSANTVLTAGSVVPTWDLVDPVSIANGSAGYVLTAGSAVPTWAPLAATGKILQVIRATDTTSRTTTSTSFVDVTGMAITITPQKSDSNILVFASFGARSDRTSATEAYVEYILTDNSNNSLSGAQSAVLGLKQSGSTNIGAIGQFVLWGYSSPGNTSAITYKLRFNALFSNTTATVRNDLTTGQMYAIEVAA